MLEQLLAKEDACRLDAITYAIVLSRLRSGTRKQSSSNSNCPFPVPDSENARSPNGGFDTEWLLHKSFAWSHRP